MINKKNVFMVVYASCICCIVFALVNLSNNSYEIAIHVSALIILITIVILNLINQNEPKTKHKPIDIGKAIECGLSPNLIDSFKIVENHLSKHVPDSFAIFESNVVIWSNIGREVTYLLSYCKDGRIVLLAGKVVSETDEASGMPCQTTDFKTPIFVIPFDSERTWEFVKIMKMLIK